ncbi:MAG TPA: hypothetical protein VFA09_02355 [Ktedonobacteraceae bacterium]|jgi:hypothetical protein|nr:hypothetical protein [Ktedonobacteraceae bacterium]
MDPTSAAQLKIYEPWFIIAGVFVCFILLRFTRKALRRRIDEIGYRLRGERGLLFWFWLNAPGVIVHELSHALVVLLFRPFGFRITSISFFHIQPQQQRGPGGRVVKSGRRQSLQLGEVQYIRPSGRFMSYVGDGMSAIAPLFGGIGMLLLLYWVATGYSLWDLSIQHFQLLRPGWPWWTLVFAPYLILTVTSEFWPSHQDWRGARWFLMGLASLLLAAVAFLYLLKYLVFNNALLQQVSAIALHIDLALGVLLVLDLLFLLIAELLLQLVRR